MDNEVWWPHLRCSGKQPLRRHRLDIDELYVLYSGPVLMLYSVGEPSVLPQELRAG
jgi:hypothetical protein